MSLSEVTQPTPTSLNDFIDLDRYPIHQLDTERGEELIHRCQNMMASDSICVLPGFLRKIAVDHLSAEITNLETIAHRINYPSTMYGWMNNAGFPADHPRTYLARRTCGVITTDQIDRSGPCMHLFGFDELTEFVRRLLAFDTLYRSICPTLAVQVNVMDNSDEFSWHFDSNDGVVSFSIQNADQGGGFEYAAHIRDENDENYAGISQLLKGEVMPLRPTLDPGAFSLFMGRRSLHRVAEVGATQRKRQSLLFSYDREPDMVFPKLTCKRISGEESGPYLGALTPVP
jgi:hypothetical protein